MPHLSIRDPADGGVAEAKVVADGFEAVAVDEMGLAVAAVALRSPRLADPGKHGGERRTVGTTLGQRDLLKIGRSLTTAIRALPRPVAW
jgi:hypothetical protein